MKIDTNHFFDLSIAINKRGNVNCYYLDDPNFTYFENEAFSGNLSAGGSVNCERISLYPHASGTHTECALHIAEAGFDMRNVQLPPLILCRLQTVIPTEKDGDRLIDHQAIGSITNAHHCEALILRTTPNTDEKLTANYSGSNPCYFEPELLLSLKNSGYKHLLTDLPSIDRESDEGKLSAHKFWFLTDGKASPDRTITELIYVHDRIPDGLYALNLQIPKMETDAVPSRVIIYPCV